MNHRNQSRDFGGMNKKGFNTHEAHAHIVNVGNSKNTKVTKETNGKVNAHVTSTSAQRDSTVNSSSNSAAIKAANAFAES